jgi:hypothetical protein
VLRGRTPPESVFDGGAIGGKPRLDRVEESEQGEHFSHAPPP